MRQNPAILSEKLNSLACVGDRHVLKIGGRDPYDFLRITEYAAP